MTIPRASEATSEERIIAALAHATILFMGWGAPAAIAIWAWQRQKSAFTAFHALQAVVYQLAQVVYWLVVSVLFTLGIIGLILFSVLAVNEASSEEAMVAVVMGGQFAMMGGLFCAFGLYIFGGILGALLTIGRKDFRYPLIGKWLERYLNAGDGPVTVPPAGEPEEVAE